MATHATDQDMVFLTWGGGGDIWSDYRQHNIYKDKSGKLASTVVSAYFGPFWIPCWSQQNFSLFEKIP